MLWKFKDAWLFFCAGRAHCAMHREGAMEYGLIRTNTDEYGRGFGSLTAMRSRNSKAHGTQYAMYSPLRTTPYTSVPIRTRLRFATPRQAKCLASQQYTQPCAPEIQKHMALSMPCTPLSVLLRTHPYLSVPVFAALRRGKPALPTVSALRYRRFESPIFSAFYLQKSTNGCIVL